MNIRGPGGGSSRSKTTMLQLPRFLLRLEPGQMLRVAPLPQSVHFCVTLLILNLLLDVHVNLRVHPHVCI